MGSAVTIGMRTSAGDVLCAESYSHVFDRLFVEVDLVTPNESEMRRLIEEYANDTSYGPLPLVPCGAGIVFFDLMSKTIFDAQRITYFPTISRDSVSTFLYHSPDRFALYAPHFVGIREAKLSEELSLSLVERRFANAMSVEGLWENLGYETTPAELSKRENGVDVLVAEAILPKNDFVSLTLDLPNWTVRTYKVSQKNVWDEILTDISKVIDLSDEDKAGWAEYAANR